MSRRELLVAAALSIVSPSAFAQDTVKIGLILPMTGQQASTGKQIDAAVKLYQARNGTTVAGKKVEVILKDDTGVPDIAKRMAQELVGNDKEAILASVERTSRVLIVHEDVKTLGIGAELSAVITEERFDWLDAPILRVTYPDTHCPFAHALEQANLPNADKITEALRKLAAY